MARIPDYRDAGADLPFSIGLIASIAIIILGGKIFYEFLKHIGVF
jgi:hypothetical protein